MQAQDSILAEIRNTVRYRWVIFYFVYSSLKHRYRKSFLGFFWSVLTPLLQNLIIGVVFFSLFRFNMPHYVVYLFSGVVIYNLFSNVINNSPTVLISNENFIKKIYAPKLVYIIQIIVLETINFTFVLTSLIILGIVFSQISFSLEYLFLPVPVFLTILFLIGEVCIVGVLAVYFRDFLFIIPVVMQTVFFLTPVLYPISLLPLYLQKIIRLNPLYWYVQLFRGPIYEGSLPHLYLVAACTILSFSTFLIGLWVLKKFDNKIIFRL
jgi:ABC-type polysaccharide/polyol phosphate export permease